MSLKGRAVKGTLWVAGGAYIIQGVNFLSNILLMRLIAPEYFGVLALAVFFITLGQKLGAFGYNHALIHRQEDLDKATDTHLFLHLSTSALVLLLALLFFPVLKGRYDALTAAATLWLGVSNLFQCAGNTPRIRMEKDLDFAPVMKVNVAATLISDAASVILALAGMGIGALIARQILADLIATMGYFRSFGPRIRLRPDWGMIRWYFRFGVYLWLAGLATLVSLKFDDFLVGTMVDAESLGYYARAYWMASLPTIMIAHVVAKVSFPLYSKLQTDREKLSEVFFTTMRAILILTFPLSFGLAMAAPEFVSVFFGEAWMPMAPLIRLLLIYASLRPLFDNTGELFTAVGQPKIAGINLIGQAAAVLLFCPLFVHFRQAQGAAVAVGISLAAGVVLAYRQLPRYVNISFAALLFAPLLSSIAGAAVVWAGLRLWPIEGDLERLLAKSLLFLAGFSICLGALSGRQIVQDVRKLQRILKER